MKAISRWLDRFCYNHPQFRHPEPDEVYCHRQCTGLFSGYVFQGICLLDAVLSTPLILQGQVWRVITFVFVPVATGATTP